MSLLSAKDITKIFAGGVKVLDGVSLEIEKGDFLSITGASGSGKSTLLTILGGIDKPGSGSVVLDGEEISAYTEKQLAKLRRTKIGFVFQFFNLATYLTAYENILLPIVLSGKVTAEAEQKAAELMEYLGIAHLKEKLPATLSGGEQQRVAIARGLVFNPEIILLDEPTGNLDSRASGEIMDLLGDINKKFGTTIVQVTHSAENARYGNRIIHIQDGKIADGEVTA